MHEFLKFTLVFDVLQILVLLVSLLYQSMCLHQCFLNFKIPITGNFIFENRYTLPVSETEPENREGVLFLGRLSIFGCGENTDFRNHF